MSKHTHQEDCWDFESDFCCLEFGMYFFGFIVCLCMLIPTLRSFHNSYDYEKVSNVTATVIDKEYRVNDSYYMIGPTIGIDQEEEYLLTLKYDEVYTIIKDQTLYNTLDVGATINVNLYEYYDKDGNITSKKLVIKEE